MFTGIVEELGTVEAVEDQGDAIRLTVKASLVLEDAGLGDSISVNGCCLTVAERTEATWTADVMQETLDKTSLHGVQPGDRVNLERAVTADKRLGGHIVQGHVDGVGTIVRRTPSEHWEVVEISLPPQLARYLVDKGSITVDGVSLTVVEPTDDGFTVAVIPHTAEVTDQGDAIRLTVEAATVLEGTVLGDSISVNGCCLTVSELGEGRWTADLMQETLDKTSLRGAAPGDRVNLERAVTVDKRLGGHIVQGHVDGVGEVITRSPSEHWDVVEISLPAHLSRYLVDKGSITVDGVSLTVVEAREDSFTVSLIPETLARTTLGSRRVGDLVNLEADVIAKHVEKLLGAYTPTSAGTHAPENDEEE